MKALCFLLMSLTVFQARAAVDPLLLAVERDLNNIFSETINEGETTAEVLRENGRPQVHCSKPFQSRGKKLMFCSVTIKTQYGENLENTGQTTCTSLGYEILKNHQVDQYNGDKFERCMEQVNDASYD